MDLRDLVDALLRRDALRARQWVADAERFGFDWTKVTEPLELDPVGRAVAASIVEMMAARPEPLRRRGLLAPPEFLTAA